MSRHFTFRLLILPLCVSEILSRHMEVNVYIPIGNSFPEKNKGRILYRVFSYTNPTM